MCTNNKRFLTIDLDMLFLDCPTYHKTIDEELTPEHSWEVIRAKHKDLTFEPDRYTLAWLIQLLTLTTTANTTVNIINEHDEMINVLKENNAFNAHCTNIDYHHDLRYDDEVGELSIENWVTYARKGMFIKDYHWITQDDASMCPLNTFSYTYSTWKDTALDLVEPYDVITICISKHFTPPEHWQLADELLNFIKETQEEQTWEGGSVEDSEDSQDK